MKLGTRYYPNKEWWCCVPDYFLFPLKYNGPDNEGFDPCDDIDNFGTFVLVFDHREERAERINRSDPNYITPIKYTTHERIKL